MIEAGDDLAGPILLLFQIDEPPLSRLFRDHVWARDSAGALAWHPENGAIYGPSYDAEQAEAERMGRGMWRGEFVPLGSGEDSSEADSRESDQRRRPSSDGDPGMHLLPSADPVNWPRDGSREQERCAE